MVMMKELILVLVLSCGVFELVHAGSEHDHHGDDGHGHDDEATYQTFARCNHFESLLSPFAAEGLSVVQVSSDGKTVTSVSIALTENGTASSLPNIEGHIHDDVCDNNGGGPHWKKDSNGGATMDNEVHVMFPNTTTGNYATVTVSPFTVDNRIKSIVIHHTNGTKMVCCDLTLQNNAAASVGSSYMLVLLLAAFSIVMMD